MNTSNFRRVLNAVCFLLANSSAFEICIPTFRYTVFHLHRWVGLKNDWVWEIWGVYGKTLALNPFNRSLRKGDTQLKHKCLTSATPWLTPIRSVPLSHTYPWPSLGVFVLHGLLYEVRHNVVLTELQNQCIMCIYRQNTTILLVKEAIQHIRHNYMLRYKSEVRWVDRSWYRCNFSLTKTFLSHYGPGVDSASNRNEYQEHFLGVKTAGA